MENSNQRFEKLFKDSFYYKLLSPFCYARSETKSAILVKSIMEISCEKIQFYFQQFKRRLPVQIRNLYLRKSSIIFLPINLNICFGCSKEPSHCGGSFEYPQHMFWMRNKENNFPIRTLIWRPELVFLLSSLVAIMF